MEMVIKIIAKGNNKYTYLRNPWNWLDFVNMRQLAWRLAFLVLRALKAVSIMPGYGLKTIINGLTLTIFCLMVFALFALQVYMGELIGQTYLTWTSVCEYST